MVGSCSALDRRGGVGLAVAPRGADPAGCDRPLPGERVVVARLARRLGGDCAPAIAPDGHVSSEGERGGEREAHAGLLCPRALLGGPVCCRISANIWGSPSRGLRLVLPHARKREIDLNQFFHLLRKVPTSQSMISTLSLCWPLGGFTFRLCFAAPSLPCLGEAQGSARRGPAPDVVRRSYCEGGTPHCFTLILSLHFHARPGLSPCGALA